VCELNNVAVDLYTQGDYVTAIDLYKDAAKANMLATQLKENASMYIDDGLRAGFIAQIVRGKQQLYELTLLSQSSNDDLESYQWSESGNDGSPRCLSEALKIENAQGHGTCDGYSNAATFMYNTGLIHMKSGEFENAEICFGYARECYNLTREDRQFDDASNLGCNALVFAAVFNNIGCLQYRNGNMMDAQGSFNRALEIGKIALKHTSGSTMVKMMQGYKHVGTIYYNIGVINERIGLNDKIMEPLEYSLGLQKVALGENHPDIAVVQHNIGVVLIGAGRWTDAMNAFLESLRMIRFVFGNDDYQVVKELFYLGKVLEMKGEHNEALHVYEEALRVERLTCGEVHPETMLMMYKIGQIYQNKGHLNEALVVYYDIIDMSKVANDIEESIPIMILGEMVTIYLEMGDIDVATKIHAEVLRTIELDSPDRTSFDILALAQVEDILVNPSNAAAA
jgi:tetratricopeptide (TPR) repeat protein